MIFWVDLTEEIRILSALRLAIFFFRLQRKLEPCLGSRFRRSASYANVFTKSPMIVFSLAGGVVVERLGVADRAEHVGMVGAHVAEQARSRSG